MKMFATGLLFAMALLACSLPDPGCDDHSCDEKCLPALRKHVKSMSIDLGLTCPLDTPCTASLYFGIVKELGWESQECHDGYEYTFVSGSIKDTVTKFSKKMLTLSDDHLRFSLFDSAKVEKKYDIDLSSIIHSYTIDGDSVRITLPYPGEMKVRCPICQELGENCDIMSDKVCQYINENDSFMTVTIGYDWDNNYRFGYGLSNQGPLGSDTIDVGGRIYFRE